MARKHYFGEQADSMDALDLLMQGSLALSDMHVRGICIDREGCMSASRKVRNRLRRMRKKLESTELYQTGVDTFGISFDPDSPQQLGEVLFNVMGKKVTVRTPTGKPSVTEEALQKIDDEGVRLLLKMRKLAKVQSTYLKNIINETVDGVIHPFFSLALVSTYRSSSQRPNFQNMPIRNKVQGSIIRGVFVPRTPEHHLVEIDYSSLEVNIAACYHQDPTMIRYLVDPHSDMHRDAARDCFGIEEDQVSKGVRYLAKNAFVFPEFYGSYYVQCAKNLWERAQKPDTLLADGTPLWDHMKSRGWHKYAKYERHLQRIENVFWKERFPVYDMWKKQQWERYLKDGFVKSYTGFTYRGDMVRNQVINYPVQGAAFHCLLKSTIELNRILKEKSQRSWLVGQIHDSIVADVHEEELEKFLKLAQRIMTQWLPKQWSWIIVPLEVEAEVAPVGQPWSKKEPYPIKGA